MTALTDSKQNLRRPPWGWLAFGVVTWIAAYASLMPFADAALALLGLTRQTHLGEAVHFFFYDTPKVLLLLAGIVFLMGVVHTFVSPERTRALLSGKRARRRQRDGGEPRGRHPALLLLRGAFLHMAGDALVSFGVVASGALYLRTGWAWLDPVTSMAVALVIIVATWGLFRGALHLLFDGVPESVVLADVAAQLRALPGVIDVHDLHVWAMSTSDIALTAHLVMPAGNPGDAFLERIRQELHDRFHITHPTIQIELEALNQGCANGDSGRCL